MFANQQQCVSLEGIQIALNLESKDVDHGTSASLLFPPQSETLYCIGLRLCLVSDGDFIT